MATGSDVNQVVTIHQRCAPKSIEWASRRGLQFDTAKTEAALFTRRRGHKKHLRPKLTAKIRVGDGFIPFNSQATCWLGVWMDTHLTLKEHHNRCMKNVRAAEARLRTLTKTYGVVPERVRAIQVACVQAVALYGSELWWDPNEPGRRDDLQLLLNRQARSILDALPTTPRGALIRDSGLTPVPGILESSQQRFAARLANTCCNKLRKLHQHPCSPSAKNISVRAEWFRQSGRAPSEPSETPRWGINPRPASIPRVALHIALRSLFCRFFSLCRSLILNKHSGVVANCDHTSEWIHWVHVCIGIAMGDAAKISPRVPSTLSSRSIGR